MSTLRDTPAPPLKSWPPRACEDADWRLFFPGGDKGGQRTRAEAAAKAYCRPCEARRHCAAYAVPITDLGGVWGAMSQNERARARKKRKEA